MDEDQKKRVAVFRFGVIHDLVGHIELSRGEQERLLSEKTRKKWMIPYSQKTRLTRSTILRWVRLYKNGSEKIEALFPQNRVDCGDSRVLNKEEALVLIQVRQEMPKATVPALLKEIENRQCFSIGKKI